MELTQDSNFEEISEKRVKVEKVDNRIQSCIEAAIENSICFEG